MVTKAEVGCEFVTKTGTWTLAAPCETKDQGYWYCITHKTALHNNFAKDSHSARGRHVLAWHCLACGQFEQP